MTIEQNNIVYDHILVRFGELSTKGKNKKDFIKRLLLNVKHALRDFDKLTYERTHDRLYIMLHSEDPYAVQVPLAKVFGISSFSFAIQVTSDIEEIKQVALQVFNEIKGETFKIVARRSDKTFPLVSDEINRIVAGEILRNLSTWRVDVKQPDVRLQIEIHTTHTYIMTGKIAGAGGYPVGVGGKAMLMLSGGIDSPVAGFLAMKRGISIECIHYASPPYTSKAAVDKVLALAAKLAPYQGHIRVHIVPFTKLQLAIYKNCDESYAITIMRRMMYRLAQMLCEKQHCLAMVNGESIGQVASQTLESMQAINHVTNFPVIRPVACLDKLEIIEQANRIGTYETSILPYEDCCTIFTPKNPVTKPTIRRCEAMEERFDYRALLQACIEEAKVEDIYPVHRISTDLF